MLPHFNYSKKNLEVDENNNVFNENNELKEIRLIRKSQIIHREYQQLPIKRDFLRVINPVI